MTFAFAEAGTRLFVPQLKFTNTTSKLIGWSSPEVVKFNPFAPEWAACQKRILFLGDSYLAALPGEDARFPTLISKRHPGICTAILATGGWGTDQQMIALFAKGMAWKPDLVVVAFTAINDAANNFSREGGQKPYFFFDRDGALRNSLMPSQSVETVLQDVPAFASDKYDSQAWRLIVINWRKMMAGLRGKVPALESVILPNGMLASGSAGLAAGDPDYDLFCGTSASAKSERKNLTVCDDVLFLAEPQKRAAWDPRATVSHLSAYLPDGNRFSATAWRLTEAILGQMNGAIQARGGKMAVLLHPDTLIPADLRFVTGAAFEQDYDSPGGVFRYKADQPVVELSAMARKQGFALVNPNPAILARIEKDRLADKVWPNLQDPHYSALGHELVADELETALPTLLGSGKAEGGM
ncbi:MAG: SGNH/GDSL hydrolase family protein [Alphaproteobacteria bacterium]|nr:SGNH/GDSL hydrolase family protein [Alphaproteobacteria bacterium]